MGHDKAVTVILPSSDSSGLVFKSVYSQFDENVFE